MTDKFGVAHHARALIDPGSKTFLTSEALAQRLGLPRLPASVSIFGVGGQKTAILRGRINIIVKSRVGPASFSTSALILPRLTAYGGKISADCSSWPHLRELELADPEVSKQDLIELLLGADVYSIILLEGLKKGNPCSPIAQRTSLGWIISGLVGTSGEKQEIAAIQCYVGEELSVLVRRFWEQEELPEVSPPLSVAEEQCEKFFARSHTRTPDGRYMVRLPLASALPDLSDTRRSAIRLLHAMKRRFEADAAFRDLYTSFIKEYESLGHMTEAQPLPIDELPQACYLPHHGVIREASQSTKLRVVFNGSQRTRAGDLLNQCLLVGPNLLPALPDVLLRWRRHKFVIISDVEKMYRQIMVHPDDRNLQRILWRDAQIIKEYQLNTVTYGLACAPFLAIRTLQQLANDEESRFPVGSAALRHDVYVDDILTGAQSLNEALVLRDQLLNLCKAGGFPLKKWAANSTTSLDDLAPDLLSKQSLHSLQACENHSALGLQWNSREDCFKFLIHPHQTAVIITKRSLLSETAQLFDPLSWLAPVIVRAKLIIQATWLHHLNWDTPLRKEEANAWMNLRQELSSLKDIRVPRWIHSDAKIELHGFADASERAYAAVTYCRVQFKDSQVATSLLLAKTKVAPLKKISVPQLELCAASLLVKIITHVIKVMKLISIAVHLWSDSTVTLEWIRAAIPQNDRRTWLTECPKFNALFLKHDGIILRVNKTQQTVHLAAYLRSNCSRNHLGGTSFLAYKPSRWPRSSGASQEEDFPEQRSQTHSIAVEEASKESDILIRFSSLHRLLRVTAWLLRWTKLRKTRSSDTSNILSLDELRHAERCGSNMCNQPRSSQNSLRCDKTSSSKLAAR